MASCTSKWCAAARSRSAACSDGRGLDSEVELNEWLDEMKWIGAEAKRRGLDVDKTLERVYGRAGISAAIAAEEKSDDPAAAAPAKDKPSAE
jgi:hypothetical protein